MAKTAAKLDREINEILRKSWPHATVKAKHAFSEEQINALQLAASRKSGLISAGHGYPTSVNTLRSLTKRGLMEFVAKGGSYYDMRFQYRITDAGRDVDEQLGSS